jgi:hypothetical protein
MQIGTGEVTRGIREFYCLLRLQIRKTLDASGFSAFPPRGAGKLPFAAAFELRQTVWVMHALGEYRGQNNFER